MTDKQNPGSILLDFSGTFKENAGSKLFNQKSKLGEEFAKRRSLRHKVSKNLLKESNEQNIPVKLKEPSRCQSTSVNADHKVSSSAAPEQRSVSKNTNVKGNQKLRNEPSTCDIPQLQQYALGQLEVRGLPPVNFDCLSSLDVTTTLVELLRMEERTQRRASEIADDMHNAESQVKHLSTENERLKLQVKCLNQDNVALENKYKATVKLAKKEKAGLEKWIKELNVDITKLQGQQRQWQATMNKRESEYERLKERMQKLHCQRDKSIKRGITHNQGLPETVEQASLEARELESLVASDYMDQRAQLASENEFLRNNLKDLQDMLDGNATLNGRKDDDDTTESIEDDPASVNIYTTVCHNLPTDTLKDKLDQMRRDVDRITQTSTSDKGDVEWLHNKLKEATEVITRQDELLQLSLFQTEHASEHQKNDEKHFNDYDCDEVLTEKEEALNREAERLTRLREQLKRDQRVLLLESEKLDADRLVFEHEYLNACVATPEKFKSDDTAYFGVEKGIVSPTPGNFEIEKCILQPTPLTKALLIQCGGVESAQPDSSSQQLNGQVMQPRKLDLLDEDVRKESEASEKLL